MAPEKIGIGDLRTLTTYQAGVMQTIAHQTLQKLCDDILTPYGLTKLQWLIIGTTRDAGQHGVRISKLRTWLGVTPSHLRNMLRSLEARHIIKWNFDRAGRRSHLVHINPDFAPDCEEIEHSLREGMRESIYATITPIEFRVYMKVLYRFSQMQQPQQFKP